MSGRPSSTVDDSPSNVYELIGAAIRSVRIARTQEAGPSIAELRSVIELGIESAFDQPLSEAEARVARKSTRGQKGIELEKDPRKVIRERPTT